MLCILIVRDGEDREDEFRQPQITEFLCGDEFAVEGLALLSSYGKTEVQHLETPSVCGLVNDKADRVFQMLAARQAPPLLFQIFKDPFS